MALFFLCITGYLLGIVLCSVIDTYRQTKKLRRRLWAERREEDKYD